MDCLTQHYDAARTGWNSSETALTPATVAGGKFGRVFTQQVDGQVYAQPLYASGLDLPAYGVHDVVFVATEGGTVWAFDAADPGPVSATGPQVYYWKTALVPAGERPFKTPTDLRSGCTDLVPDVCVTSTPVIDRAAGIMYLAAKTIPLAGGAPHYRLHAIQLADGTPRQPPVEITGSVPGNGATSANGKITFDPKHHHNRPGLLLSGGTLYLAFASHCDTSPYFGWVFAYDASTLTRKAVFNAAPDKSKRPAKGFSDHGAGIWQGGIGLAGDAQGNVYFQTGNGPFDLDLGGKDCGDSVVRLNPDLNLGPKGYFTPFDQERLNQVDLDLGSGGVMLLPDQPQPHPHLMVSCGKEGTVYLIDRDNPGGYTANANKVVGSLTRAVGGVWGGPAYYHGPQGQLIYYCGRNHPLQSLLLNNGRIKAHSKSASNYSPATPTVSSNGPAAGTGVVWLTQVTGANLSLLAFDADDLAAKPFEAVAGPYNGGPKFTVPTVADGRVFVGADRMLAVFALAP